MAFACSKHKSTGSILSAVNTVNLVNPFRKTTAARRRGENQNRRLAAVGTGFGLC